MEFAVSFSKICPKKKSWAELGQANKVLVGFKKHKIKQERGQMKRKIAETMEIKPDEIYINLYSGKKVQVIKLSRGLVNFKMLDSNTYVNVGVPVFRRTYLPTL